MNRTLASALAVSVLALAAGQALAAEKTREQVTAEYLEAVRTGNIVAGIDGYGNQKLNEVFPGSYPAQAKSAGKTRAEVNAELTQAIRSGALNQQTFY